MKARQDGGVGCPASWIPACSCSRPPEWSSSTVLEASTEYSIIGLRLDGRILLWNSGARRLYGYKPGEIVGNAKVDLLHTPEDLAEGLPRPCDMQPWMTANGKGSLPGVRRDGSKFSAKVVLTPRRNREGEPIGFLLISRKAAMLPAAVL